jgi:hypothetical protein
MAIREQPHYEIAPSELAAWTERHGINTWWAVDGDVYLSSRVPTPCRGDELAAVLRRANRPLLVATHDITANGQIITRNDLDRIADNLGNIYSIDPALPIPSWANDRCFWLCWKGDDAEWLLTEDSAATEAFRDVITQPLITNP